MKTPDLKVRQMFVGGCKCLVNNEDEGYMVLSESTIFLSTTNQEM